MIKVGRAAVHRADSAREAMLRPNGSIVPGAISDVCASVIAPH